MNFQMFKLVLENAEEPEIKLPTSAGSSKKEEFQKNIYFCFIDYAKDFNYVDHSKLWKILKFLEYQATLPTSWETCMQIKKQQLEPDMKKTDYFKIGRGVCQGCILTPCLFNLYAEFIMQNVGLDEAQAGVKTDGRNINNLRYEDDITLMAESE